MTYEGKSSCTVVFSTKKGLLECKPEWNREAVTVFSRLPSLRRLQATPPLQTSLIGLLLDSCLKSLKSFWTSYHYPSNFQ